MFFWLTLILYVILHRYGVVNRMMECHTILNRYIKNTYI